MASLTGAIMSATQAHDLLVERFGLIIVGD